MRAAAHPRGERAAPGLVSELASHADASHGAPTQEQRSSEADMSRRLSRRNLLLGAGGAVAGFAGIHAPALAGRVSRGEVIAGSIASLSFPDKAEIDASDGTARVVFPRTATFWRDHPAQLVDFLPGDEVVAEGHWAVGRFEAEYLISMFRPVDGQVVEMTKDQLVTTGGVVRLTRDTRIHSGEASTPARAATIRAGEEVAILARRDSQTNTLVAVAIVRSEHPQETA